MKDYNAIGAIAREQKISPDLLKVNLLFEALRAVMKAHEQDAAFTPAQAQGELKQAFARKIEEAAKSQAK